MTNACIAFGCLLVALAANSCTAKGEDGNSAPKAGLETSKPKYSWENARKKVVAPKAEKKAAPSKELDLTVKADRDLLLRHYVAGVVETADEAMAEKKRADDACQSNSVCSWSRGTPLPNLISGTDARFFRESRFNVSYTKGDSKNFAVHTTLPTSRGWGQSFSCALLKNAVPVPTKAVPGIASVTCKLTEGPAKGGLLTFSQLGPGPAHITLKSPARS